MSWCGLCEWKHQVAISQNGHFGDSQDKTQQQPHPKTENETIKQKQTKKEGKKRDSILPWDDATLSWRVCDTLHGEGFSASCLSVRKNGAIVAFSHTLPTCKYTHTICLYKDYRWNTLKPAACTEIITKIHSDHVLVYRPSQKYTQTMCLSTDHYRYKLRSSACMQTITELHWKHQLISNIGTIIQNNKTIFLYQRPSQNYTETIFL